MVSGGFFKKFRILILLFVLFIVGVDTYLTKIRSTDWDRPLTVVIYPINGDSSETSQQYMQNLSGEVFQPLESFFKEEALEYELALNTPVEIRLAPPLNELPPKAPADKTPLKVMWWSLKMRWWSATVEESYQGPPANIKMYVSYYDPDVHPRLDHSLGLQKGLIGVVHAFSQTKYNGQNNIVIAHEMLHTVGASDKYDLSSGNPNYPDGYADASKEPVYPQDFAEIMGGKIPLSATETKMPNSLDECLVGPKTAEEINWISS